MKVKPSHKTTFHGEFVDLGAMQIDPDQGVKLALIISGMYAKDYSSIREYISNGKTATQRIGSNKPVEVRFSTYGDNDQFVTITDYGVGMTLEDMKHDLLWLGRSTSDLEVDSAGGFGIGAKSGLSVTPQFHISSTKDGVTTNIQIKRDENGISTTLMGQGEAEEGLHGTTVTLPLSQTQMNSMLSSVKENLIPFYPEDEVIFYIDDIKVDSGHSLVGRRIKDVIIDNSYNSSSYSYPYSVNPKTFAIVAGAPYPIDFDISQYTNGVPVSVIFMENEDVTIPSNREGLEASQLTHDSLKRKLDECHEVLASEINEELSQFTIDNLSNFMDKINDKSMLISNCNINVNSSDSSRGFFSLTGHYKAEYIVDSPNIMSTDTKTFRRFKDNYTGDDLDFIEKVLSEGKSISYLAGYDYNNEGVRIQSKFFTMDTKVSISLSTNNFSSSRYLTSVKGTPLSNGGEAFIVDATLGDLHNSGLIHLVTKDEYNEIAKKIRSISAKAYRKENAKVSDKKERAKRSKSNIDIYVNGAEVDYDLKNPIKSQCKKVFIFSSSEFISNEHKVMCAMGELVIVRRHGIPTKSIMKFLGLEDVEPVLITKDDTSSIWEFKSNYLCGHSVSEVKPFIEVNEWLIKFAKRVDKETHLFTLDTDVIEETKEEIKKLKKVEKYIPDDIESSIVHLNVPLLEEKNIYFNEIVSMVSRISGTYSHQNRYCKNIDESMLFHMEDDIIKIIKSLSSI